MNILQHTARLLAPLTDPKRLEALSNEEKRRWLVDKTFLGLALPAVFPTRLITRNDPTGDTEVGIFLCLSALGCIVTIPALIIFGPMLLIYRRFSDVEELNEKTLYQQPNNADDDDEMLSDDNG